MPQPSPANVQEFQRAVTSLDRFVPRCESELRIPLTPYRLLDQLKTDSRAREWLGGEEACRELRAVLAQEICAMALPALLDGGENAVAMAATRKFEDAATLAVHKTKFSILENSDYLNSLRERIPSGYGFVTYPAHLLVEPRDLVRTLGHRMEESFPLAYPVVYELQGLTHPLEMRPMPGWLAFAFVKPASMKHQVALVREKTREAVAAIARLNGKLVGLGGWLASLTDGGAYLEGKTEAQVTTGHAYTIASVVNTMRMATESVGLSLNHAVIAVVGAAGSVGSGIARLCARLPIRQLILFDERCLDKTIQQIRDDPSACSEGSRRVPSFAGHLAKDLGKADVVLVATTAVEALFDPHWFRPGAIVIDDSQPKSISRKLLAERDDILILEGGVVSPPLREYSVHPAFGPSLKRFQWSHVNLPMARPAEIPCCLAETMVWSLLGEMRERYSTGKADPELAGYLDIRAGQLGFGPGVLQCFGEAVEPSRVWRVHKIHESISSDHRESAPRW